MNPRYRRLLIPGLLIGLLVVVVVSALIDRAEGAEGPGEVVCRISDPRIVESSGLAISAADRDLAYTVNDSGNDPLVFAVRVSTCRVVGVTRLEGGTLRDVEALALAGDGTLWVADTGDNAGTRSDAALYALPEPGTGDRTVTAGRYPVSYEGGPHNVEALAIDQTTQTMLLISKGLLGGTVFELPAELATDRPNVAIPRPDAAPSMVTDAAFTRDGSLLVLRNYGAVFLVDPADATVLDSFDAPRQPQGETVAVESNGRSLLLGSEGAGSALIRVPFEVPAAAAAPTPTPAPTQEPSVAAAVTTGSETRGRPLLVAAVVTTVALGTGVAVLARRRR